MGYQYQIYVPTHDSASKAQGAPNITEEEGE